MCFFPLLLRVLMNTCERATKDARKFHALDKTESGFHKAGKTKYHTAVCELINCKMDRKSSKRKQKIFLLLLER